jgi:hypothetical protein
LPIERVQASEWRRRAGRRILERFKLKPREPDYYTTTEASGPARLVAMTLESDHPWWGVARAVVGRPRHTCGDEEELSRSGCEEALEE